MPLETPFVAAPQGATPSNPADLLAEKEAAVYLNVAIQTLRNWRWKGEGPRYVKVGVRLVRYRRGDLTAFVEAGSPSKVA